MDHSPSTHRRRRVVVGLVVVALVAGVLAAGWWRYWPRESYTSEGPVVAHASDPGSGFDAAIQGELSVDGGCLLLGDSPVVWPRGTGWDADEQAVVLPGGAVVRDGDTVSGGGGSFGGGDDGVFEAGPIAELLAGCRSTGEQVTVFNATDEVEVDS